MSGRRPAGHRRLNGARSHGKQPRRVNTDGLQETMGGARGDAALNDLTCTTCTTGAAARRVTRSTRTNVAGGVDASGTLCASKPQYEQASNESRSEERR